jgi:universal stress protein A
LSVRATVVREDASYEPVLRAAARLAGSRPLHVLHVFASPSSAELEEVPTTTPAERTAAARDALKRQIEADLAALSLDAQVSVPVGRLYNLADDIAQHAQVLDAEVIVIGTHGRKGLVRLVLGSVAESVVRHAHCDVHVVRPRPPA